MAIFSIAFMLNFFNRLRQEYILRTGQCSVPPKPNQTTYRLSENSCNDFQYSITISAGIGFIFLGNVYDNVERPRQVTVLLLIILASISLVEAILSVSSTNVTIQQKDVSLTLYQMSSVFEAGLSLACIVILHNWFKEEILGTITALWFVAIYVQVVIQDIIYSGFNNSLQPPNDPESIVVHQLQLQSIVLCVFYAIFAVICWFFFYHHPAHIGINIRKDQGNVENFGFNIDTSSSMYKAKKSDSIAVDGQDSNVAIEASASENKQNQKLDVTLIDAFRIKEINLLIISYIIREAHDAFIKQTF